MPVRSEKVTFSGTDGHELAGRLDLPDGEPVAYALFAHCFTCGKDVFAAARIASTLAQEGIGVLRFDFTGLGHSEGEFANTNFSSNVGDLVQAAFSPSQPEPEAEAQAEEAVLVDDSTASDASAEQKSVDTDA